MKVYAIGLYDYTTNIPINGPTFVTPSALENPDMKLYTEEEIKNIKAWLLTLTHNKAISYLRKAENSNEISSWEEIDDFQITGNLQTPDEQIISREEIAQINHLIQTLPPKCKMVFVLAKMERLPYKEITKILNISVKTINIHIAKALEIISEGLRK